METTEFKYTTVFRGTVLSLPCLDKFLEGVMCPAGHNWKGGLWNSRDFADAKCVFTILKSQRVLNNNEVCSFCFRNNRPSLSFEDKSVTVTQQTECLLCQSNEGRGIAME